MESCEKIEQCEIIEDYCDSPAEDDNVLLLIIQLLQQSINRMGACISELDNDNTPSCRLQYLMTVCSNNSNISDLYKLHKDNYMDLLHAVCDHHEYWHDGAGQSRLYLEILSELNIELKYPGLAGLLLEWITEYVPCPPKCDITKCKGHYNSEKIDDLKILILLVTEPEVDKNSNTEKSP